MGTAIADLLVIHVPAGGRVLVASDLHLGGQGSHKPLEELTATIERASGQGVLILNGDILELATGKAPDVRTILDAEGRFSAAVREFAAGEGRRVVYVLGNHDSRLAWDTAGAAAVSEAFCCDLALALEVQIDTGAGVRRVQVEHGHRLDPANAYTDPRDPLDVPLGILVARQLTPSREKYNIFEDVDGLADALAFPRFVASRLAYRRFARHLKWLLLPLLVAVVLKLPLTLTLLSKIHVGHRIAQWPDRFLFIFGLVVADFVLIGAAIALAAYTVWEAVAHAALNPRRGRNEAARLDALARVREGYAGMITGHTHSAELGPIGDGFYANTGCCAEVLDESRARLGPLPVFRPVRETCWIELEAGADLHARLIRGRQPMPAGSTLERLMVRSERSDPRPRVVASLPGGEAWPPPLHQVGHQRSVRARAATAIALVGMLNLISAVVPPVYTRLRWLRTLVPLAVPEAAAALVALAGLGLLFVSVGVRRGGRRAWATALILLGGSAFLHLAKGVEIYGALIALLVAAYLGTQQASFRGGAARGGVSTALRTAVVGLVAVIAAGTTAVEFLTRPRLGMPTALGAVTGRMFGSTTVAVPDRLSDFLNPVMVSVSLGLLALVLWTVFRPAHAGRRLPGSDLATAREIVARYGSDSLAFFALRQDKQLFFFGESCVAYSVVGRVCLVSPDPVGPAWERDQTWQAFHRFADGQGWPVAVLGASEAWLPTYRRSGMRDLYVGDEAIVDCHRFHAEQARWRELRQEVAGVQALGYRVEFFDPVRLDPFVESELRGLATESHHPEAERHFSMTLGRLFGPEDRGLVVAVAFGPDGHPAAFCQFVPAPAIDGYTLDQLRRTTRKLPGAVADLLIVESIAHLAQGGVRAVSMNFSVIRRTLASPDGPRLGGRGQRWLLDHIARATAPSPWSVDERYEPTWCSRFFVYDGRGHFPAAAMAVARSESATPTPTVGASFLVHAGAPAANGKPAMNGLQPARSTTHEVPGGSTPPEAG
ncbi:MAG TPA: phosphatidylglycerol lysyltransferase domain-containing protein [Actinomycetota bacterium]|nr:phosphatidylglycerol lysyltransferase domain-containing protein [Actinomycetota bacterium]